jgi:hypothetical protein
MAEYEGPMTTTVKFKDGRPDEVHPDLGFQLERNNDLLYVVDTDSGKMETEHRISDLTEVSIKFTE